MSKVDLIGIGKRIQNRRKQLMLTQEQLAEMMNVSIQMVSNLERGNKAIRIDNLINLSQLLDISTDYILTGKATTDDIEVLTSRISQLSIKERKMIEMLVDYCLTENPPQEK
ncbi:MAG: helix-turn-helix transcriptional regulator [Oscillospiraceae bacterium]|nr:helix-turn-helix transcriptional regulator [Oscillospiraceae bacterium]